MQDYLSRQDYKFNGSNLAEPDTSGWRVHIRATRCLYKEQRHLLGLQCNTYHVASRTRFRTSPDCSMAYNDSGFQSIAATDKCVRSALLIESMEVAQRLACAVCPRSCNPQWPSCSVWVRFDHTLEFLREFREAHEPISWAVRPRAWSFIEI